MALVVSDRLDLQTDKIRAKQPQWEAYARAGKIASADVAQIQKVVSNSSTNASSSSASASKQADLLSPDQQGSDYAQLYVRLLSTLNRNDTLAYVLVLMGDMISVDTKERIPLFTQCDASEPLIQLLKTTTDDFIRLKAAVILSLIVSEEPDSANTSTLETLCTCLAKLLGSTVNDADDWDTDNQAIALQCLSVIARTSQTRLALWKRETDEKTAKENKPVGAVVNILRVISQSLASNSSGIASGTATPRTGTSSVESSPSGSPQMQYYVGLAIWTLSYQKEIAEQFNETYPQLIPLLTQLVKAAIKEKVVRVILATFRNFANLAAPQNLPSMFTSKLLPYLNQITSAKRWSDEEVKDDAAYLKEQLANVRKTLTTYDEYKEELNSGMLDWSNPTHEDGDFWRENAKKLEDENKKGLKSLVTVLKTTKDDKILSVACNDLSMYLKYADSTSGRKYVSDLGGKARVMEIVADKSTDSEVKFRALMAVQRLVSHSWT